MGEGDEFAALWGDGGLIDDMTLAEEFCFGGDEDGFGADSGREFGFEGSPEVGSGDRGLSLPSGGFAHGGDGFAGLEGESRAYSEHEDDESTRDWIGCWRRDSVHGERIGDIGDRAAIAGMNGCCGLTGGVWVPLIGALRRLGRGL